MPSAPRFVMGPDGRPMPAPLPGLPLGPAPAAATPAAASPGFSKVGSAVPMAPQPVPPAAAAAPTLRTRGAPSPWNVPSGDGVPAAPAARPGVAHAPTQPMPAIPQGPIPRAASPAPGPAQAPTLIRRSTEPLSSVQPMVATQPSVNLPPRVPTAQRSPWSVPDAGGSPGAAADAPRGATAANPATSQPPWAQPAPSTSTSASATPSKPQWAENATVMPSTPGALRPPAPAAQAPAWSTPQAGPGTPQYAQPSQPQYAPPQQPQYAQPQYAQPSQPQYAQPSPPQQPQYAQPQYAQPSQPQYAPPQQPQQPQYAQPQYAQPARGSQPAAGALGAPPPVAGPLPSPHSAVGTALGAPSPQSPGSEYAPPRNAPVSQPRPVSQPSAAPAAGPVAGDPERFDGIPGYRILRTLGKGGMGEVFLAERVTSEGVTLRCVIKTILPHAVKDAQFRELFLDEARLVALLRHPNVVSVFDFGRAGDRLYQTLEWVEGLDASGLMKKAEASTGEIPLRHLIYVLRDTLQGLHYAHTAVDGSGRPLRIVHRDISPGNILISRQGAVKLSDFGVAVGTVTETAGAADSLAGKPHYFAPELWKGARSSAQTDVFALGVTFYEMLTLKPLFSRNKNLHGLAWEITQFDPRNLIATNLTIPDGIEQIILRSLAPTPEERYQNALEFLEDVNDYAYEYGIRLLDAHFARYIEQVLAGGQQSTDGRKLLFRGPDEG